MCLPSRCLAVNVYSDFAIPAFERHVTVLSQHLLEGLGKTMKKKTVKNFDFPAEIHTEQMLF
jgi:hypothetical protein